MSPSPIPHLHTAGSRSGSWPARRPFNELGTFAPTVMMHILSFVHTWLDSRRLCPVHHVDETHNPRHRSFPRFPPGPVAPPPGRHCSCSSTSSRVPVRVRRRRHRRHDAAENVGAVFMHNARRSTTDCPDVVLTGFKHTSRVTTSHDIVPSQPGWPI